jgi:hypothetical protein
MGAIGHDKPRDPQALVVRSVESPLLMELKNLLFGRHPLKNRRNPILKRLSMDGVDDTDEEWHKQDEAPGAHAAATFFSYQIVYSGIVHPRAEMYPLFGEQASNVILLR